MSVGQCLLGGVSVTTPYLALTTVHVCPSFQPFWINFALLNIVVSINFALLNVVVSTSEGKWWHRSVPRIATIMKQKAHWR